MSSSVLDAEQVFVGLCETLRDLDPRALAGCTFSADLRLSEDLGLDSLKLVDLTLALEQRFELDELPMHEWLDGLRRTRDTATLGALVELIRANA